MPAQIARQLVAGKALDLIEKDPEPFANRKPIYFGRQRQIRVQWSPRDQPQQLCAIVSLPNRGDATLVLDDRVQLVRVSEPGLQEQSTPFGLIQVSLKAGLGPKSWARLG